MANPNQQPPYSTPQNSVEAPGVYTTGGGIMFMKDGGPAAFGEKRRYGWSIDDDPRNTTVATMLYGSAGAKEKKKKDKNGKVKLDKDGNEIWEKPSQTAEDNFRDPYLISTDPAHPINPRANLRINDEGKSSAYKQRKVEWAIDGRVQKLAATAGKFALDSVKHLVGVKAKHGHHAHYTNSGIGKYTEELSLDELPANYDAHDKMFKADTLERMNLTVDRLTMQAAQTLGRKLKADEAKALRDGVINQFVEKYKNPDYPNTPALREMVSAQMRIERRRREDEQKAIDLQVARLRMQQEAEAAAKLQQEAHKATLRMDKRSEQEVKDAKQRHTDLMDELRGNNNETLNFIEDKIIPLLKEVRDGVKDMPDLKADFETFFAEWRKETKAAGADRDKRAQADSDMLYRLNTIYLMMAASRRDANNAATAQTANSAAQAQAMGRHARATEEVAEEVRKINEHLQGNAGTETTAQASAPSAPETPAAPSAGQTVPPEPSAPSPEQAAPAAPVSEPSRPVQTPEKPGIVDADVIEEDPAAYSHLMSNRPALRSVLSDLSTGRKTTDQIAYQLADNGLLGPGEAISAANTFLQNALNEGLVVRAAGGGYQFAEGVTLEDALERFGIRTQAIGSSPETQDGQSNSG